MGNSHYASRYLAVASALLILVSIILFKAAPVSAAEFWPGFPFGNGFSSSTEIRVGNALIDIRLCQRQLKLGNRLSVPLILPGACNSSPTPTPTLTFTATPSTIVSGATSTLAWVSTNVTSCTASNGWSGTKALSGSESVSPTATTTYALNCTGPNGPVLKSVTVNVTPTTPGAPTLTLTATPTTVQVGATSTLAWTTTNATSCTASGGWTGSKALSGNQIFTVSATTTYILNCTGAGGPIQREVTVNTTPQPTPTITLSANPLTIPVNGTSTLTWSSTNTTLCVASNGWTGNKATSGTQQVTPSATSTYALACGGAFGTTSASVTVNVTPNPVVTVALTANPTSVTPGAGTATTTLTWTSTNATSCTASNGWSGTKALSGSEVVSPSATTTYQLNCSGPGGVGSDEEIVNFVPTSSPGATLTFSANPTSVTPGAGSASSTLTWNSTNATLCLASNGWTGSKTLSGSLVVTPIATTTYTLACGNAVSTSTQSVTVNFVPTPVEGKLLITEVIYDLNTSTTSPQGSESANEWVELYNGTNGSIDLGTLFIGDASSTDALPSVSLPAGKFAIISASSTTASFWNFPIDAVVIVLSTNIGQNGLGNGGDTVRLLDAASTTIDAVSWGTDVSAFNPSVPTFIANAGDSIGRISITSDTDTAADWERKMTPTPGE